MTDPDPRLPDESAQKVLARALELQAHSAGGLTVAQIREIASELAIPEHAVDQALAEYRSAGAAELSSRSNPPGASTPAVRRQSARPAVIVLATIGGAFLLLTIFFVIMRIFVSS